MDMIYNRKSSNDNTWTKLLDYIKGRSKSMLENDFELDSPYGEPTYAY